MPSVFNSTRPVGAASNKPHATSNKLQVPSNEQPAESHDAKRRRHLLLMADG
jgi:hypothetical protein